MKYHNINETTLINHVAQDFFAKFDCTETIKNIDITVQTKQETPMEEKFFLWAEAKAQATDPLTMLTQLILTIGKSRITDEIQPPPFLGCFDCNQIAFVEYSDIVDLFHLNDFNWKVTPSDTSKKEFNLVYKKLESLFDKSTARMPLLQAKKYIFDFIEDEKELHEFIKQNFIHGKTDTSKIQITKNNFTWVYIRWHSEVKPTIEVTDWDLAKQLGIFDLDFYLADLLSRDDVSLKDKLNIVLKHTQYEVKPEKARIGLFNSYNIAFNDGQKAHRQFWQTYERPPREEYWDYIIDRCDLLVPQDIRERKGSFFTPQIWVELSQKYLADVFGEDWQENYYIWDCAAGTGNLLAGLTNKYRIWASTIDQADVKIMHERIKDGANLLEEHTFQFDFLNDSFAELPPSLKTVIKNEPEKLIIYINPPYAEAGSSKTARGTGSNKPGVSINNNIANKYKSMLGKAINEIFILFLIRIYYEIPGCKIGNFSKTKALCSKNFIDFRQHFQAKIETLFLMPAKTFDNVKGNFPIGFHIWDTLKKVTFSKTTADVYNTEGKYISQKNIYDINRDKSLNEWMKRFKDNKYEQVIGYLPNSGTDFQNQNYIFISNMKGERHVYYLPITKNNLLHAVIYFSATRSIPATWLNDRDQFLYPNDGWEEDKLFQTDCLVYTLFHNSNNIQSKYGINHWIPFTESEVNAKAKFESNFMTDFIKGRIVTTVSLPLIFEVTTASQPLIFDEVATASRCLNINQNNGETPLLQFSYRANEVFKAAKELWKYYHCQSKCNVNASFYDIREHFQGRDEQGKMKSSSDDGKYNKLLSDLRLEMKFLAWQIEPKIYKYGFLNE